MQHEPKFIDLLSVFDRHGVEHIVVGGVAAGFAGAPIITLDLDVVFRRTKENASRLEAALREVEAIYRDPAGRRIIPDVERLLTAKIHLLETRLGYLDVLASIGAGWHFEDLEPRSSNLQVAGLTVRVLDLAAVIESKEHANRPKDRNMLSELRETLRMKGGS